MLSKGFESNRISCSAAGNSLSAVAVSLSAVFCCLKSLSLAEFGAAKEEATAHNNETKVSVLNKFFILFTYHRHMNIITSSLAK